MLTSLKEKALKEAQRVASTVDEKMAKVDAQIDRVASMRGGTAPQIKASQSTALPTTANVTREGSQTVGPQEPRPVVPMQTPPSAADASAAFESVPKAELVTLLVKTNSRCKQLEMRYAELKRLHEALLEEKRQLVATRGRMGASMETAREQLETTLRQAYEDRMQEFEEQVSASGQIKKQLQSELSQVAQQLRDERSARQLADDALHKAEAEVNAMRAEASKSTRAAEVAAQEAESARTSATIEQSTLLERVMQLEGELATLRHDASTCMPGGVAAAAPTAHEQQQRQLNVSEVARRAEREAALNAQQRLREAVAAGEAALAAAHGELSEARRLHTKAEEEAAAQITGLHEQLRTTEHALSRALSNYKEEVGRWGEKIASLERAKVAATEAADLHVERIVTEWEGKLAGALRASDERAAQARVEMEAELAVTRSTAAADTDGARERIANAERRAEAQVAAAMAERDAAVESAQEAVEEVRRGAAERIAMLEDELQSTKASKNALAREHDQVSSKLLALEREMVEESARASQQVERWAQQSASASEHEALVVRLRKQLDEAEGGYRQAKSGTHCLHQLPSIPACCPPAARLLLLHAAPATRPYFYLRGIHAFCRPRLSLQ